MFIGNIPFSQRNTGAASTWVEGDWDLRSSGSSSGTSLTLSDTAWDGNWDSWKWLWLSGAGLDEDLKRFIFSRNYGYQTYFSTIVFGDASEAIPDNFKHCPLMYGINYDATNDIIMISWRGSLAATEVGTPNNTGPMTWRISRGGARTEITQFGLDEDLSGLANCPGVQVIEANDYTTYVIGDTINLRVFGNFTVNPEKERIIYKDGISAFGSVFVASSDQNVTRTFNSVTYATDPWTHVQLGKLISRDDQSSLGSNTPVWTATDWTIDTINGDTLTLTGGDSEQFLKDFMVNYPIWNGDSEAIVRGLSVNSFELYDYYSNTWTGWTVGDTIHTDGRNLVPQDVTFGQWTQDLGSGARFGSRNDIGLSSGSTVSMNLHCNIGCFGGWTYNTDNYGDIRGTTYVDNNPGTVVANTVASKYVTIRGATFSGVKCMFTPSEDFIVAPEVNIVSSQEGMYIRYLPNAANVDIEVDAKSSYGTILWNSNERESRVNLPNLPIGADGLPQNVIFRGELSGVYRHFLTTYKPDTNFKVTDVFTGNPIEGAAVYIRDYDHSDRENYEYTNSTRANGALNDTTLTDDKVYAGFTNSEGIVTFDILTRVHLSDDANVAGSWSYRSKDGDRSDLFDVFVSAHGYQTGVVEIVAAGKEKSPTITIPMTPDVNITGDSDDFVGNLTGVNTVNEIIDCAAQYQWFGRDDGFGTRWTDTPAAGTNVPRSGDSDFENIYRNAPFSLPFSITGNTLDFGTKNIYWDATGDIYHEDSDRHVYLNNADDNDINLSSRTIQTSGLITLGDHKVTNGGFSNCVIQNPITYTSPVSDTAVTNSFSDVEFAGNAISVEVNNTDKYLAFNECSGSLVVLASGSGTGRLYIQGAPAATNITDPRVLTISSLKVNVTAPDDGEDNEYRISISNSTNPDVNLYTEVVTTRTKTLDFSSSIESWVTPGDELIFTVSGGTTSQVRTTKTLTVGSDVVDIVLSRVAFTDLPVPSEVSIVADWDSDAQILTGIVTGCDSEAPAGGSIMDAAQTNKALHNFLTGTEDYNRMLATSSSAVDALSSYGTLYAIIDGDYLKLKPGDQYSQHVGHIERGSVGVSFKVPNGAARIIIDSNSLGSSPNQILADVLAALQQGNVATGDVIDPVIRNQKLVTLIGGAYDSDGTLVFEPPL